jgi:hypothetical protein
MKKNLMMFAASASIAFAATSALLRKRRRRSGLALVQELGYHPGECVGSACD